MSWVFLFREVARVQVVSFPRRTHKSSLRQRQGGRPFPGGGKGWHLGEGVDQCLWEREIASTSKVEEVEMSG